MKKLILIIAELVLLTSCGSGGSSGGNSSNQLQAYAPYGAWPLNNNDQSNSGVATSSTINTANAMSLQKAFQINLPNDGVDSTPVIADNNIYFASGKGVVSAVNGTTGEVIWQQTLSANGHLELFDETPVLTKSKLFIAQDNMFALDRSSGEVLWSVPIYDFAGNPSCTNLNISEMEASQLALAGNKVIYTFGFSDEAAGSGTTNYACEHGEIVAVNQNTGNIDWRLDLTQVNGVQYGGGTGGFGQAAVDNVRHVLYMGTSNAYSAPASPYADALVAINYDTGKVIWSYQFYANDVWSQDTNNLTYGQQDLDVRGHPQLFTLNINNVPTDFVSVTGKDGTLRIFKRDQATSAAVPVAQVQWGPATASDGAIQLNPVIYNGIIYMTTTFSIITPAIQSYVSTFFPSSVLGQQVSLDFPVNLAGQVGGLTFAQSNLLAVDLAKLINYGINNPESTPVCYGTFWPPLCSGQLPTDQGIVIYDVNLGNVAPLSSSGIAYANGVLFIPNIFGNLLMVNAQAGNILGSINVAPANPPIFGTLPNNLLTGGVSIQNGTIYVPYGLTYGTNTIGDGGVVAFSLPGS